MVACKLPLAWDEMRRALYIYIACPVVVAMGILSLIAAFMVRFFAYFSPKHTMPAPGEERKTCEQTPTGSPEPQIARSEKRAHTSGTAAPSPDLEILTKQLQSLKTEHDELKIQHAAAVTARQTAEATCDGLRRECREQRGERDKAMKEFATLLGTHVEMQARWEASKKAEEEAQTTAAAMKKTVKEQEEVLLNMRQTISNKDSLLRTRSSELREAQAFLSTADRLSHAEVLAMVHALNAQMHQLAAQIADCAKLSDSWAAKLRCTAQREHVENIIGKGMAGLLWSMRGRADLICVQMALQASLCQGVASITYAWGLALRSRENDLLAQIYNAILASGE